MAVLGHVDHGKTALVRALTGTDTDRLPEERRRGISIQPGYARLAGEAAELDLVDVPGHERFIRAMVAGSAAMRAALLLVDAREGVRAQTREHAEVALLLGVRRGVVAISRADLAPPEAADADARALLRELGLDGWPVLPCSARTGEGVGALAAALLDLAEEPVPGEPGRAWMPLDRAFQRPGFGLVVTGASQAGRLAPGDAVELWPGGRAATIRTVQSHGRPLEAAGPGRRVALSLRGASAAPGEMLASPGLLAESRLLDAMLHVLPSAPRALRAGEALRLLCGPVEARARLRLPGLRELAPGAAQPVQLALDAPLAIPVRAPFILRAESPARTVAGGVVLDAEAPRRRAPAMALPAAMAALPPPEAAMLALRDAGARGMDANRLRRLAGGAWPPGAERLAGDVTLHPEALAALEAALLEAVRFAGPLGAEARALLRGALPAGAPGEAVAARLLARKRLRLEAGRLLPAEEVAPDPAVAALLAAMETAWRHAGCTPPDTRSVVAGEARRAAALAHLLRRGVLLRAPDAVQKREWLFHRDALAKARDTLRPVLRAVPEGLPVSALNAVLGVTRRHGVPLLERLDADGFTERRGDLRVLREP